MQQLNDGYRRFKHYDGEAQRRWVELDEELQGLLDTTRKILKESFESDLIILEAGREKWQPHLCVVADVSHLAVTQAEDILSTLEETWGKTFLRRVEKANEESERKWKLLFGFTRRFATDGHISTLEVVYAFHEEPGDIPF